MSDNDVFLNFLETENIDFVKIFIDIKLDDIKNLDYEWFGGIEDKAQGAFIRRVSSDSVKAYIMPKVKKIYFKHTAGQDLDDNNITNSVLQGEGKVLNFMKENIILEKLQFSLNGRYKAELEERASYLKSIELKLSDVYQTFVIF